MLALQSPSQHRYASLTAPFTQGGLLKLDAAQEFPLHKGTFKLDAAQEFPLHKGTFKLDAAQEFPLHKGTFLI